MKNELTKLILMHYPQLEVKFIFVNGFKISSLCKYKDSLPDCLRSGVVYKFSCAQCASEYIGSSVRMLGVRAYEHMGRSFRTGKPFLSAPKSAISDHLPSCPSNIDLKDFSILDSTNSDYDLRLLESIYIHYNKPILNQMISSFPLKILK